MRTGWILCALIAAGLLALALWTRDTAAPVSEAARDARETAEESVQLETRPGANGPYGADDTPEDPGPKRHGTPYRREPEPWKVQVVSKSDGQPIQGASVRLRTSPLARPDDLELEQVTDAAGDAQFENGLGFDRVVVRKPGFLTAWFEDERPDRIALESATPLRGRVVDAASGVGIAGVRVRADWVDRYEDRVDVDQVTDADGAFVIAGVPEGQAFEVIAARDGYSTVVQRLIDPEDTLDITLGAGAEVSGRVTDSQNAPIAGAEVFVAARGAPTPLRDPRWSAEDAAFRRARAVTDASGRYVIRGVGAPAIVLAYARSADGAEGVSEPVDLVAKGREAHADIQVRRTGTIVVNAVDASTGERIQTGPMRISVDAEWTRHRDDQRASNREDPKGFVARLNAVPAGEHRVYVLPDEYLEPPPLHVTVEAGKETHVEVRLEAGRTVTGRTVNTTGEPVQVYVSFGATHRGVEQYPNARSDKDGRFTLRGVPPVAGELAAWDDDVGRSVWANREIAGDLGNLVVGPASHVIGTIPEALRGRSFDVGVNSRPGGWTGGIDVAPSGLFRISNVPVDTPVDLFVRTEGLPPWVLRGLVVRKGAGKNVGTLVFPEPIAFERQLLDAMGQPVHGALVRTVEWWSEERVRTSKDGRFTLPLLPPGRSTLWIETAPHALWFEVVDVRPDVAAEPIRLPRPGTCRVTLVTSDGVAVANAPLNLYRLLDTGVPDWSRRVIIRTDSQGKAALSLYPGAYGVKPHNVNKFALTHEAPRFEIVSGETREVELRIRKP